jgi:hypothetical protein
MSQLLFLILLGLAVGLGWRFVSRQRDRVINALRQAETSMRQREQPVTLERDPKTGVYRPPGRSG